MVAALLVVALVTLVVAWCLERQKDPFATDPVLQYYWSRACSGMFEADLQREREQNKRLSRMLEALQRYNP